MSLVVILGFVFGTLFPILVISWLVSIVIAVSEGIQTKDGKFVCELGADDRAVDAFGHKQLSGCAATLANIVAKETGLKTRAIEFSTLQRAAAHLASLTDINEAESLGAAAVEAAHNGKTGVMSIIDGKGNISTYDIHEIANVEKKVPTEWYDNKKINLYNINQSLRGIL